MEKYFLLISGTKFYCDVNGVLKTNDAGAPEAVPADDTEATEVEAPAEGQGDEVDEVEKMVKAAADKAAAKSENGFKKSMDEATKSISSMFESLASNAKDATKSVVEPADDSVEKEVKAIQKGLANLKDGQSQSFAFDIKSKAHLDYLAKSTDKGDLTGDVLEVDNVPGISRDPVRMPFIETIADTAPMTGEALSYVEVTSESGAPATSAELAAMAEKDFVFEEFKANLKKVGVTNKHSVELLEDGPQLVNAIKGWLNEDLNIVVDTQLLSGDGTGANLSGVIGQATTLTAGSRVISNPTINDVLRVARTEIAKAGKGKFRATHVILHPDEVEDMELAKDANDNYILPPFRSADGSMVAGARVIENTGITAGTFLMGDFTKLHVGFKGGVRVEMTNSDGTDFAKDILTVKLVRRLASYVRANDSGAFYTGTVATIITDLTS